MYSSMGKVFTDQKIDKETYIRTLTHSLTHTQTENTNLRNCLNLSHDLVKKINVFDSVHQHPYCHSPCRVNVSLGYDSLLMLTLYHHRRRRHRHPIWLLRGSFFETLNSFSAAIKHTFAINLDEFSVCYDYHRSEFQAKWSDSFK